MKDKVRDDYERPIISLRISITNRCNVNCIYCHHDGMLDSSSEMTPDEIYEIYKKSDYDAEEVDAMYREFKQLAKKFTEERLQNQNRLVGIGWLDDASYEYLTARTPYDLFVATDYQSIDVSSLYNDFGPKWYLETSVDEEGNVSYFIPIDSNFLPPAANWSVPTYLAAMQKDTWLTITYGDGWTPVFPVTVSEDRNTIVINPLVYTTDEGEKLTMYPNMLANDPTYGTMLENPVVSEIVLTRGWEGSDKKQSSVLVSSGKSVNVQGNLPETVYKKMTKLVAPEQLEKMEVEVVGVEQFHENAKKFIENFYANQNN